MGMGEVGLANRLESDEEVPSDGSGDSGTRSDEGGRNF